MGHPPDSARVSVGTGFAQLSNMHISIERLYDFVIGQVDLTEAEQSHLIRCSSCVEWLDACVTEKVALLTDS